MYLCAGGTYLCAPKHQTVHQYTRRPSCAPGDQVTHQPTRRTRFFTRKPGAPGCLPGDQAHQVTHQATWRIVGWKLSFWNFYRFYEISIQHCVMHSVIVMRHGFLNKISIIAMEFQFLDFKILRNLSNAIYSYTRSSQFSN